MDEEAQNDIQKAISDSPMEADEGPLINENSNGLSHLLTEGEFNSVDAVAADESSTSNQGFLNAVELSTGSVGDYLESNTDGFNSESFDVGDNAVTFPSDSLNNVLSDGDSNLGDTLYKSSVGDPDGDISGSQPAKMDTDNEPESEFSNDMSHLEPAEESTFDRNDAAFENELTNDNEQILQQEVVHKTGIEKLSSVQQNETEIDQSTDKIKRRNEQFLSEKTTKEVGDAGETEVVSEDELPTVEKPSVKDAENVSDDELPGPKPAEQPSVKDAENVSDDELPGPKPADLPADTEVVSEDELPSSKKEVKESRKRKNEEEKEGETGSPSAESETKKQAVVKNGESKPVPAEKRPSIDEKPKKKVLPELDKYWKVVNDDPNDFTGWTYLLQYVDQESDVEAAREAYDAFLSHYPYCYGYWRKYADYEKKKGSKKKCLEVLERGLKAIPLSVDLWIHYLNHVKTTRTDEHNYIRSQYERAIEACGLEFRSDRLWESYIKWESENGSALNVTRIYDRLLATPTLGYTTHFDNFQEHVQAEPVNGVISKEELVALREAVRGEGGAPPPPPPADLPPGEDEPPDHIASEEEAQAIKERVVAARRKLHKSTGEEVAARWTFEEGIKRPYFHVKPLERCQLKNWKSYLEWEKAHGSLRRALVLHERCLIACALYDEFWMRLIKFLEERIPTNPELVAVEREVLERACTVHHLDKPELHLHWAYFEEAQGGAARAADILERIEKACPNLVQIQYRRINLERRRGDLDKCVQLYESYISSAKNKSVASALAIKYARFLFHVRGDKPAARKVLDDAVEKEPLNPRLHMQRLDLALHTPGTAYEELEDLVKSYEAQEGAEAEVCAQFAWRRRELAEEAGGAAAARDAADHQRALARHLRKRARKDKHDAPPPPPQAASEPKKKESPSAVSSTSNAGNMGNAGGAGGAYYGAGGGYEQYPQNYQAPWGYQQPGPYGHGGHPAHPPHPAAAPGWPQYPNYY